MGTCIKIEALRGSETISDKWKYFTDFFKENFPDYENDDENFIDSGLIFCSYSRAYLKMQIPKKVMTFLKDSNITLRLFYEERDPDECLTL